MAACGLVLLPLAYPPTPLRSSREGEAERGGDASSSPACLPQHSVFPSPPPCFISGTNHMVTAPSNLWGRVCKCVFLSSDLQIVPFIAFVTVKIKVPGWPAPQITESAQGAAAGWELMVGSGPCDRMCVCARTLTSIHPHLCCGLTPRNSKLCPSCCDSELFIAQLVTSSSRLSSRITLPVP